MAGVIRFNNNLNFLQLVNVEPAEMVGTAFAYWTSSAMNELRLTASGANADGENSHARFGDNDAPGQSGAATAGTFLSYELDATFAGLNTAAWDSALGAFASTGDPDGISISGGFQALFHNTGSSEASNGFYVIDLTFTNDSWAYANRSDLTGDPFPDSIFGASAVVPEPSSVVMAGLGVVGLGVFLSRRRKTS